MKQIIWFVVLGLASFSCSTGGGELDFSTQLKKDIATIDEYLAKNNVTAVKDSSGVRYVIQTQGAGSKPTQTSKIGVKYIASTLGSTQSFDQSEGAVFLLSDLIAGWQIALPKIEKGSTFTLYIPSGLGFGPAGASAVPPNSNLVFEVELFDDDARHVSDVAAIDHYLDSIGATHVHRDPSGIRYVFTDSTANGPVASLYSTVQVTYSGKLMKAPQTVFDTQSSAVTFTVSSLIEGWKVALQKIPSGRTFVLYVPSGMAYGPAVPNANNGTSKIPANSNLIFNIKFITTN